MFNIFGKAKDSDTAFRLFGGLSPKDPDRGFRRSDEECYVCGKSMKRHSRMGFNRCMTTPLNIRITDQGRSRLW
jgi:hypothetical protein